MFKKFKNRKAQNTAEYAILIALVVGGVIAMQTYAQRTLQGRIRDASVMFRDSTNALGDTLQYEPYYTNTQSQVDRYSEATDTYQNQERITNTQTLNTGYRERTEYLTGAVDTPIGEQENSGF